MITAAGTGDAGEYHRLSLCAGHAANDPTGSELDSYCQTPLVAERRHREDAGIGIAGVPRTLTASNGVKFQAWISTMSMSARRERP